MTRVPDFFVMGAQKAGTTTLHHWLSQSAQVALPWTKETHFFRDKDKFYKGVGWYMGQFKSLDAKSKVVGEVDPEYMYFPECAERIKSVVRAPKLIFILREPLSRARSQYQMSVRRGYEALPFSDALAAEKERLKTGGRFSQIHHSYLDRSLYGKQLELILAHFDESEVLVLMFDELFLSQDSAEKALSKIFNFLGIDLKKININISVRENSASIPRFSFVRDFIYKKSLIKKLIGKTIPSPGIKIKIMRFLDRINSKKMINMKSEGYDDACPEFVYKLLIEDLYRVQASCGVDVSRWIAAYEMRLGK